LTCPLRGDPPRTSIARKDSDALAGEVGAERSTCAPRTRASRVPYSQRSRYLTAGSVHVLYDPVLLLRIFGPQLLIAFTITAFGVMVAITIRQAQTFTNVMQMLMMPMLLLSAALYPASGLPT
jgi:hypothetical protein